MMTRLEFVLDKGNIKEQTRRELQRVFAADYRAAAREDRAYDKGRIAMERVQLDSFPMSVTPSVDWGSVRTRRYNVMDRVDRSIVGSRRDPDADRERIVEDTEGLRRMAEVMSSGSIMSSPSALSRMQ